jgi:probable rRNA maturation factor
VSDDGGSGHPEPPGLPVPTILVSDRQDETLDLASLIGVARDVLMAEGYREVELSLSFVEEAEMVGLHERFMGEPGLTDVLSFPLEEDDRTEDGARVLGDVVIAPAVAARNNPADRHSELRLLVVHGTLHILGYDHEDDGERTEMWARQERYSGLTVP